MERARLSTLVRSSAADAALVCTRWAFCWVTSSICATAWLIC